MQWLFYGRQVLFHFASNKAGSQYYFRYFCTDSCLPHANCCLTAHLTIVWHHHSINILHSKLSATTQLHTAGSSNSSASTSLEHHTYLWHLPLWLLLYTSSEHVSHLAWQNVSLHQSTWEIGTHPLFLALLCSPRRIWKVVARIYCTLSCDLYCIPCSEHVTHLAWQKPPSARPPGRLAPSYYLSRCCTPRAASGK